MTKVKKLQIIKWVPRILPLGYAVFLSLFALDVFSEDLGLLEVLMGLFMHLLPTLAVLGLVLVAWKKPMVGGIMFGLLGIFFTFAFGTYESLMTFMLITMPLFLTGALFYWDSRVR